MYVCMCIGERTCIGMYVCMCICEHMCIGMYVCMCIGERMCIIINSLFILGVKRNSSAIIN